MRPGWFVLSVALLPPCLAQMPKAPDLERQRAAMKKLEFLVGKWSGDARAWRGPGGPLELAQTEDVQYKLDGLVLLIEGTGRNKSDGRTVFRALGTVSFDEERAAYRFRAYNDGRYLETDLKLAEDDKGFAWGFDLGQIKTSYVMRLNEKGEWTEVGEVTIGEQPPRKFVELRVSKL
jgi:hypothetical protein